MAATRRELRTFGLVLAAACLVLAALFWLRDRRLAAVVLGGAAAALLLPALTWPPALALPRRAWMAVSGAIGWVVLRVLIVVLFVVVLTPLGLVARLLGWDPLDGARRRRGQSNWCVPAADGRGPERYDQQF